MEKVINNDVEKIVNNQERQENIKKFHNKQKIKKRRKMIVNSCACMFLAVIFALFSFFDMFGWSAIRKMHNYLLDGRHTG